MDFLKLEPGTTIAGRYELIDNLGSGAFGAVYRARQLGIDRSVAIKLLMPDADAVDSTAVARFQREAKLSSSLEHPNTITIHDYGQWDQILYLVMEYVRGESLQQLCRREVRLNPTRALAITRQILLSLQEAHSRGIIHRDMKPANIMLFDRVGEKDVVKVLDFGIAKFISNDAEAMGAESAQKDLTVAGRIVGTPRYMAPEQIRGGEPSPASDLYAMGLILFEMLAGQRAVHGDSTISLIAMQLSDSPAVDPNDARIPATLRDLLRRATAKSLDARFTTAAEFIEAIDAIDKAQLASATSASQAAPPPLPHQSSTIGLTPLVDDDYEFVEERRLPLLPILAAAAVVAVLIAVGIGGYVAFSAGTPAQADASGTVSVDSVHTAGSDSPAEPDDIAAKEPPPQKLAAVDEGLPAAERDDAAGEPATAEGAPDAGAADPEIQGPEADGDGSIAPDLDEVDEPPDEAADAARKAAVKKARDKKKKKDKETKAPADPPKETKDNTYKPF